MRDLISRGFSIDYETQFFIKMTCLYVKVTEKKSVVLISEIYIYLHVYAHVVWLFNTFCYVVP